MRCIVLGVRAAQATAAGQQWMQSTVQYYEGRYNHKMPGQMPIRTSTEAAKRPASCRSLFDIVETLKLGSCCRRQLGVQISRSMMLEAVWLAMSHETDVCQENTEIIPLLTPMSYGR